MSHQFRLILYLVGRILQEIQKAIIIYLVVDISIAEQVCSFPIKWRWAAVKLMVRKKKKKFYVTYKSWPDNF